MNNTKVTDDTLFRESLQKERKTGQLLIKLIAEIDRLNEAIRLTLVENCHLADGDNCTLLRLKRAMENTRDVIPPLAAVTCSPALSERWKIRAERHRAHAANEDGDDYIRGMFAGYAAALEKVVSEARPAINRLINRRNAAGRGV